MIGHHLRRPYELVAHHGLSARADLYSAAAVSTSSGDEAVTALEILGLVTRTGHGTVAAGLTTLDNISAAHNTDGLREDRIIRFRAERDQWPAWLAERDTLAEHPDVRNTFWATAMANGPPDDAYVTFTYIDDAQAVETVLAMLGGRILTNA